MTWKKIYFLSDLHMGASYITDRKEHQRKVSEWLRSIAGDARRVYLLGDVLDYWFEYRTVVPKGYTRFFGAVAELTDAGVEVVWLKGNHDIWIYGYLQDELGVKVVDGVLEEDIDGRRFLMEHGDGVGYQPRSYRVMRSIFRNSLCRHLYAAIPPSLSVRFAHGWSSHSRKNPRKQFTSAPFAGEEDSLVRFARERLADRSRPHVDYFIFGHKHLLVDYPLSDDSRLVILGDWINKFSYACWDGTSLTIRIAHA